MSIFTPLLERDLADENAINDLLAVMDAAIALVPSVPSGTIIGFAGSSAPSGWLLCDGSEVSRSLYAALFAAIGTAFGVGDGGSTFNVPDLRGRIPIGAGTGSGLSARTLAQSLGEENHLLTLAEMPSHDHTANALASVNANNDGSVSGLHYHPSNSGVTDSTGGDGAHNNMQPVLGLTPIIRV